MTKKVSAGSPPAPRPKRRVRLPASQRRNAIIDGAVQFFAAHGFSGQTRDLANSLDVTQPLLYRYFPSKKDLIDAVYQRVFLSNWSLGWEAGLRERQRPLQDRLIDFYSNYTTIIFNYEWIRIYLFSGLAGESINRNYIDMLESRILVTICKEFRFEQGVPESPPITPQELEIVWQAQGGLFYYGIRKFVYGIAPKESIANMVELVVQNLTLAFSRALTEKKSGHRRSVK
jgi:AcrR family transcriptional regulator